MVPCFKTHFGLVSNKFLTIYCVKTIYCIEKANFMNAAALVSALSSLIWTFQGASAFKSPSSLLMNN